MINPKNKRVQVTLPGETAELLQSLSTRYNKSCSEIVKWAINVLAAKKAHNFVIKLREQDPTEITTVVLDNKEYKLENMTVEERRKAKSKEVDPEDWDKITS